MTVKINGLQTRAAELANALAHEADELNQDIEGVERAIASLGLGVRAGIVLDSDVDSPWTRMLVFAKDGKTWRLMVETGYGDEDDTSVALVNASREIRLRALEALPKLLEELLESADVELERMRNTRIAAKKFAESILSQAPQVSE